jgi:hypothetical protein
MLPKSREKKISSFFSRVFFLEFFWGEPHKKILWSCNLEFFLEIFISRVFFLSFIFCPLLLRNLEIFCLKNFSSFSLYQKSHYILLIAMHAVQQWILLILKRIRIHDRFCSLGTGIQASLEQQQQEGAKTRMVFLTSSMHTPQKDSWILNTHMECH